VLPCRVLRGKKEQGEKFRDYLYQEAISKVLSSVYSLYLEGKKNQNIKTKRLFENEKKLFLIAISIPHLNQRCLI